MIDMTNNRAPYDLLTYEEKAALHDHKKAGGEFLFKAPSRGLWQSVWGPWWCVEYVYRTVPLPEKTQDVIAWDRLPDWVEWVARDMDGCVWSWKDQPEVRSTKWMSQYPSYPSTRIDDFPGIVQIGTCDWKDSKQRRPRG
jgi:hypothetical protein